MKKKIILIIFALAAANLSASTPQELMESGNKAYENKDYAAAIECYQAVLEADYTSAALYYNLGNALYRQGDYAHAILNYERALRLAPNDSEIEENLELAQSKTMGKIEPIPEFFLSRWFHSIIRLSSPEGWKIITLIIVALTLAAIVVVILGRSYTLRKSGLIASFMLSVLLICSIVNATYSSNLVSNQKEAIVIPTMISVKSSPDAASVDKFMLYSGTKVEISEEVNGWLKIEIADGNKGWLQENEIERI